MKVTWGLRGVGRAVLLMVYDSHFNHFIASRSSVAFLQVRDNH